MQEHWTYDDIKKDTILKERWTRQFAHTWTHFASWVPFVRFLQVWLLPPSETSRRVALVATAAKLRAPMLTPFDPSSDPSSVAFPCRVASTHGTQVP